MLFGLTCNPASARAVSAIALFGQAAPAQKSALNNQAAADSENYETYLGFTKTSDGSAYKVRLTDKTKTDVIIPSAYEDLPVTEIADNGFMSCRNLKTVYIPNSVKKIGKNAFYGCTALERAFGAIAVETIDNSAFSGCTKLTYFCIYDTITTLGNSVFRNVSNDIYIRMSEEEFAQRSGVNTNWSTGRASGSQIIYGTEQICETLNQTDVSEGYKLIQAQQCNANIART